MLFKHLQGTDDSHCSPSNICLLCNSRSMTPAIPCPFEIIMSVFVHGFSTTDLRVLHKGKYHYHHFRGKKSRHREVNCCWTIPHLLFGHQIIHLQCRSNFSLSFLDRSLPVLIPIESKGLCRDLNLCGVIDMVFCSLSPCGSWKSLYICLLQEELR